MNRPSVRLVIEAVAEFYGATGNDLVRRGGPRELVAIRHVAAWLARKRSFQTLEEIGLHFGGRHFTAILNSCERVEDRLAADPALAAELAEVEVAVDAAAAALARLELTRWPGDGDGDIAAIVARVIEGGAIHVPVIELRLLASAARLGLQRLDDSEPHAATIAAARRFVAALDRLAALGSTTPSRARFLRAAADSALFELRQAIDRLSSEDTETHEEPSHEHAHA